MLVLSRKVGERIVIGDNVTLVVLSVEGQRIRLGIEAPATVSIRREELLARPARPQATARKRVRVSAGDQNSTRNDVRPDTVVVVATPV